MPFNRVLFSYAAGAFITAQPQATHDGHRIDNHYFAKLVLSARSLPFAATEHPESIILKNKPIIWQNAVACDRRECGRSCSFLSPHFLPPLAVQKQKIENGRRDEKHVRMRRVKKKNDCDKLQERVRLIIIINSATAPIGHLQPVGARFSLCRAIRVTQSVRGRPCGASRATML